MKSKFLPRVFIASVAFAALTAVSHATVTVVANVLSSTSSTTTVQLSFSGNLTGLTTPANLQNYLFFGMSPALVSAATTTSADITSFSANSVQMTPTSTLGLVEVRTNGAPFYDRMGFNFSSNLTASSSFSSGSSLTVTLPIASATSSSFNGLVVYWGMPATFANDNNAKGTVVGTVSAVPETSSALIASLALAPLLRRKRAA